jgi:glutathione synthase
VKTRYLIVADALDRLNPEFDLGVCVSAELVRRGIQVDYLDLYASDANQATDAYLENLPIRTIYSADPNRREFWDLGKPHPASIEDYRVVLHRTDPPVDERFIRYAKHFENAPDEVLQINRPPATYELSEHTVHLRYPEYAAPTTVAASPAELVAAVREQHGEAVVKPKNTYCGIGIEFVDSNAREDGLHRYWEEWGPEVIVQPFLDAIESSGDLRILTIDRRVLGSVLRVPADGSRLANLHQGATAAALDPTPNQLEACRVVAEDLNPLGLHLLGLDFIGEFLTEVNITSPTTIVQINQVNGIRADVDLVDELERMWRDRVHGG